MNSSPPEPIFLKDGWFVPVHMVTDNLPPPSTPVFLQSPPPPGTPMTPPPNTPPSPSSSTSLDVCSAYYIVRAGDSCTSVAAKYNMLLTDLIDLNTNVCLENPNIQITEESICLRTTTIYVNRR